MSVAKCVQTTLDGSILLDIEVQPGAKRQGLVGVNEWRNRVCIAVKAEAQKGKANEAVMHVLSALLEVPKTTLSITSGHTSRAKTIRIEGQSATGLIKKIESRLD